MKIRILVVEDEFYTRQGICSELAKEPDFEVLPPADHGEAALARAAADRPDVLLLDIRMPGIDGLEVLRRLRAEGHPVKVIALTNEKRLIKAVEIEGGDGYVPKEKYALLATVVRCVVQSGSPVFVNPEMGDAYRVCRERVAAAELSALELDVWRLIGFKNEEIGRRLHKSPGHIRNLVAELYFKLGIVDDGKVNQRMQALEMARLYGILTAEEPI
ncbi:Response regulator transcription factor [Sulfidibacter corallicola]|uniref:Response regulator transcription factor n=1 Tax=Sulfidibacter corallicola TaxID=2818388 RepID=A0A8A4TZ87_SULCO|nr:response regulator transcription factor [Sulfidibacter corallicola]QTD51825.1 response regulator transcription factor [Sulfidibacter corallicola]